MIRTARGPRALLSSLVTDLAAVLDGRRSPDLDRPVLILVASEALRRQLTRRLLQRFGGALLGVHIQTPWVVANSLVLRDSGGMQSDPGLMDLLTARGAAEKPALGDVLGRFQNGHSLCTSSIRDLLSAGLDEENHAECIEHLNNIDSKTLRSRGHELLDLALEVRSGLSQEGVARTSGLFERAAGIIRESEGRALEASEVFIFGFSDAPGRTGEFIRALVEDNGGRFYLDLPCDLTDAQREAPGCVFARSFAARIGFDADAVDAESPARTAAASWSGLSAVGTPAEVRATAAAIGALIDDGTDPGQIAVVLRDSDDYLPEIRTQFDELGLPFHSDFLPRAFHPDHELFLATTGLLQLGPRLPLEHFLRLDAAGDDSQGSQCRDALLWVRARNMRRIEDLAAAPGDESASALPFLKGLSREEGTWKKQRAVMLPGHAGLLIKKAQDVCDRHAKLPDKLPVHEWVLQLRRMLQEVLQWSDTGRGTEVLRVLGHAAHSFSVVSTPVTRSEFRRILEGSADSELSVASGTSGSGVQVLSLEKARSLVFEHLFVLGANRGCYPRLGREDPVLPDSVRSVLKPVLPALGLHRNRPDEENYLFAQLMESAAQITLSWQRAGNDGKQLARSAWVDRIELDDSAFKIVVFPRDVTAALSLLTEGGSPVLPREAALWAALNGDEEARCEIRQAVSPGDGCSSGRLDIVRELEPDPRTPEGRARLAGASPWFGTVATDALIEPLFVTTLEGTARCPWQSFLRRALALEAVPDPWSELPGIDPRTLGQAVHGALELLLHPGRESERPSADQVARACERAAGDALAGAHLDNSGLIPILTARSRPYVERALELEFSGDAGPAVTGTEALGQFTATVEDDRTIDIHFKADRVDDGEHGRVLTDYKTGSPFTADKTQASRDRKMLAAIADGTMLQGAVYALGDQGTGRYVYLKPDAPDWCAVFSVEPSEAVRSRLAAVSRRLLAAWQSGIFPPRVEEPGGDANKQCGYCDFNAACIQGDSAQRGRLAALADRDEPAGPAEAAIQELWHLGTRVTEEAEPEA